MSNYLNRLLSRSFDQGVAIIPRLSSRFEPTNLPDIPPQINQPVPEQIEYHTEAVVGAETEWRTNKQIMSTDIHNVFSGKAPYRGTLLAALSPALSEGSLSEDFSEDFNKDSGNTQEAEIEKQTPLYRPEKILQKQEKVTVPYQEYPKKQKPLPDLSAPSDPERSQPEARSLPDIPITGKSISDQSVPDITVKSKSVPSREENSAFLFKSPEFPVEKKTVKGEDSFQQDQTPILRHTAEKTDPRSGNVSYAEQAILPEETSGKKDLRVKPNSGSFSPQITSVIPEERMPANPRKAKDSIPVTTTAPSRKSKGEEEAEPPVVRVSIGRIEVKAVTSTSTPQKRESRVQKPKLSLDEYLNSRNGGRA